MADLAASDEEPSRGHWIALGIVLIVLARLSPAWLWIPLFPILALVSYFIYSNAWILAGRIGEPETNVLLLFAVGALGIGGWTLWDAYPDAIKAIVAFPFQGLRSD